MRYGVRRPRGGVGTALLGSLALLVAPAAPATADPTTVESAYTAAGPYPVTTGTVTGAVTYDVYRPADYAALGFPSPIVTWGNGTGATPAEYTTLLDHLASWGFTVIAATQTNTGSGNALVAGAQYLVAADGDPASPYYRHLDPGAVAAVGHSQGAGGATRAALNHPELIRTLVTFSLPWNGQGPAGTIWNQPGGTGWVGTNPDCPTAADCWFNPAALTVPAFFVGTHGALDGLIANPAVERYYVDEVAGPAALGLIQNSEGGTADHSSIQNAANGGHPTGFLGYVTAWLAYRLRGDAYAARAFSGTGPELVANTNWPGSAAKP